MPYCATTHPISLYVSVAGTLWDISVKNTILINLCILLHYITTTLKANTISLYVSFHIDVVLTLPISLNTTVLMKNAYVV